MTLRPEDDLDTVATELVESRRSSLLVVDDDGRPLGRILSDDVLDALVPGHGRLHFPGCSSERRPVHGFPDGANAGETP